jgi:hypothetical protein
MQAGSSPPRSIGALAVPIGLVGVVVANTLWVGLSLGRRDDKLDTVVESTKEIKAEMYRRDDAMKDREIINVKLDGLERRVTILETARERHVAVVTARVEKQEDDLLTRAQRWLSGSKGK